MKKAITSLSICLIASAANAQSPYDWEVVNARVTSIEVTYMPSMIMFATNMPAGYCPAGTFLRWNGQGADATTQQSNAKSVLAALMSAKLSGTTVKMLGVNANCEVKFIYLQ